MTAENSSAGQLRLRALGEASLVAAAIGDAAPRTLELSKGLALVTYLASLPGRRASRDHLIDMFWSDLEVEAGRHSLRQHLWQLRRRFEDRLTIDGREILVLRSPLSFDRDDLLAAAEAGDHQAVTDRYTGELLAGFAAPGAEEFERWLELERARLRSTFVRCGDARVHQLVAEGRPREASQVARRVRDVAPDHQQTWRLLLDVLVTSGDLIGATIEAESLERRLAADDLEPEPATASLLALVRKGVSVASVHADSTIGFTAALVGREREFATLLSAWGEAMVGHASCVLITAPAGLGKSRLLHDLAIRLVSSRARVVRVRANAGATHIPDALASDLAAALARLPGARGVSVEVARTLVRLNPSLSSLYSATADANAPDELRQRMIAVRELVQAVAEDRPLAVLVDDMHWCDADSRHIVTGVFGSLEKERVLLVVAERPSEASAVLLPNARHVPLARLPLPAVVELLVSVATLPAQSWADALPSRLHRATDGSPLAVLQSLQLARDAGRLSIIDGTWSTDTPEALLATLDAGTPLRQRVSALGSAERDVLAMLAVVGGPTTLHDLSQSFDVSERELISVLQSLEQGGIAQRDEGGWRLAHDTFAEEALAQLPEQEGMRLHRAVGTFIASQSAAGRSLLSAGRHLRRAGDESGDRALFARYLEQRRLVGDRRSLSAVAAEWLGSEANETHASRLVESLPLTVRWGLSSRFTTYVAALLLLTVAGVAAAAMLLTRSASREETPYFIASGFADNGGRRMARVALDRDSGGARPFVFRTSPMQFPNTSLRELHDLLPPPHDSLPFIVVRAVKDSGVTDLFAVDASGRERRLTAARGDDVNPDWSPDGRSLVFVSARWDSLAQPDLVVMDLARDRIRRLTLTAEGEYQPRWSPDGTRIAFLADAPLRTGQQACTIRVDGTNRRCWLLPRRSSWTLGAWRGIDSLLLHQQADSLARVTVLSVESGERVEQPIPCRPLIIARDAAHVICLPIGEQLDSRRLSLAPLSPSGSAQTIPTIGGNTPFNGLAYWPARASHGEYIDSIAFGNDAATAVVGVLSTVTTTATRANGRGTTPHEVVFHSSNPAVATIDSTGVLRPRSVGRVTITASAGGWRSTRREFDVRPNSGALILRERWESNWLGRWRTFGTPAPRLRTAADGRAALSIEGEGRFHSGAYALTSFTREEGITVRARLSTIVNRPQWQDLTIALHTGVDTARLAAWDHSDGYLWSSGRLEPDAPQCRLIYAGGLEGAHYADSLQLDVSGQAIRVAAAPALRTGAWYDVVLQWLPDGRCAVAINRRVVAIARLAYQMSGETRLFLYGNAFRTQMLVGELQVTRGVDRSLDWGEILARGEMASGGAGRLPY